MAPQRSRFVTPGKICLLHLIAILSEEKIDVKAQLDILEFVTARLVPNLSPPSPKATATHLDVKLEDFERLLTAATSDGCLWQTLCLRLCRIQNLDQFFEWFSQDGNLASLYQSEASRPAKLDPRSLFGSFARKTRIEIYRLPFDELTGIWHSFCAFRQPIVSRTTGAEQILQENDVDELEDFYNNSQGRIGAAMSLGDTVDPTETLEAADDVKKLLEFQVNQMQKFGIEMPAEVKQHLRQLLTAREDESGLTHYARFLEAWYLGDYMASFENLHRYYDYASGGNGRDRSRFAYTLLNMAVLQADFDNIEDAVAAINECVVIARENRDLSCLNFSLGWLQHFRRIHRTSIGDEAHDSLMQTSDDALSYLKHKAAEQGMPSVSSTATLSEASLCLARAKRPREALTHLLQSAAVNNRFNLGAVECLQLSGQATVYSSMGAHHLAIGTLNVCLSNYKLQAEVENFVRMRCQMAYMLTSECRHTAADKLMMKLPTHQTLKTHNLVEAHRLLISLRRKLYQGRYDEVELLVESLPSIPASEPELRAESAMLELEYLMRLSRLSDAHEKFEKEMQAAQESDANVAHLVRLMIAKARLFKQAGHAQKGLTLAMRAVAIARESRLMPLLFDAVGALGAVLSAAGGSRDAERLIEAVVYQAHETLDVALLSRLQGDLADAYAATAFDLYREVSESRVAGHEATQRVTSEEMQQKKVEFGAAKQKTLKWLVEAGKSFEALEDAAGQADVRAKEALLNAWTL